MGVAILTRGQQFIWWQGANERIEKAVKPQSGLWAKIKRSAYDMGQNISFLVRKLTGYKLNFLQIPGHENCSSLVSSIISCGFEKFPSYGPNWLHTQMGVRETSQVAPSHFGMVPESFRELVPGEHIPDGAVILSLSWDRIDFGLAETLKRLSKISLKNYRLFSEIFKDGIRLTQKELLKHDDPWWRSTHAMFKRGGENGSMLVVSQEEIAKIKTYDEQDIWSGMAGEKPRYKVLAPRFLCG